MCKLMRTYYGIFLEYSLDTEDVNHPPHERIRLGEGLAGRRPGMWMQCSRRSVLAAWEVAKCDHATWLISFSTRLQHVCYQEDVCPHVSLLRI